MEKDFETLLFEQDIIRVLRKHELLPNRLTPATISIYITGGNQPLITVTSKLKTEEEEDKFYKSEEFEQEMFDEDDTPDDDLPSFDFKNRK